MMNIINPYIHNKMNKNRVKQLIKKSQATSLNRVKQLIPYLKHTTFATLDLHDVDGEETFFCDAKYIGKNSIDRGEFVMETSEGQFKVSTALESHYEYLANGDKVELSVVIVPPREEGQKPLVSVKRVFVD
jgi:hypothetical protein